MILSPDNAYLIGPPYNDEEPGDEFVVLQAENMAEVSGAVGYFSKATVNQSNPGGLPITHATLLYENGVLNPFLLRGDWNIEEVLVGAAAAAVSTATVGAAPTFRLDFYEVNLGGRLLISTVRLPCIDHASDIGANDSLVTAASFIFWEATGSLFIGNNTMLGWEFVNESGSEDTINDFARATSFIKLKRIYP